MPQLVDSEQLRHEMSYGTSDQALKMNVRKSPSLSSADSKPGSNPKLNLTLITTTALLDKVEQPKVSPLRSPPPATSPKPAASPVRPVKPQPLPQSPGNSLHTQDAARAPPLRKSPTPPEPIGSTPALQRSAEPVQLGVNQNVRRFSAHALSPAKHVPALAIAIATTANMSEKLPKIEISAPPTPEITPERVVPPPPESPLSAELNTQKSPADKHDEVHTSNEFMLVVFDKNSKVKDKDSE